MRSGASQKPDLALEVIWTTGGLDRLDIYRRLGIPEVWIWEQGQLRLYGLRQDRYEPLARSDLFPQLDINLIRSLLARPTQTAAVRELRARLRQGGR